MGEPRWSDSARVVNSSIMEQIQLLDLTSEFIFNIISILKTMDIFGMRSVDFFFKDKSVVFENLALCQFLTFTHTLSVTCRDCDHLRTRSPL